MNVPAEKAPALADALYDLRIDEVAERQRIVGELRQLYNQQAGNADVRLALAIGWFGLGHRNAALSHLHAAYGLRQQLEAAMLANLCRALLTGGLTTEANIVLGELGDLYGFSSCCAEAGMSSLLAMTAILTGRIDILRQISNGPDTDQVSQKYYSAIIENGVEDEIIPFVNCMYDAIGEYICDIIVKPSGQDPDPDRLVFEVRSPLSYRERRQLQKKFRSKLTETFDEETVVKLDVAAVLTIGQIPEGGLRIAA
jgi:hypothetical protein